MKAYLIATETVHDEAMFAKYRQEVVKTISPYGGQFIVRGGNLTILEGAWPDPRLVVSSAGGAAPSCRGQTPAARRTTCRSDATATAPTQGPLIRSAGFSALDAIPRRGNVAWSLATKTAHN